MYKYYNKKSKSPFLTDKSPKNIDSSKEQSINIENNTKDQTIEKLVLQLDSLRKKYEIEKRDMTEAFNIQIQQKLKQQQKIENEYQQKNQLLEQLLFQEQTKTIHLTRIFQEKQKSNIYDQEKEQYKNKIQQLETILQDSQRNNQKAPSKSIQKDYSYKMLLETISTVQSNVIKVSKLKKLNLSWMEYEILENDISKSKDMSKQLTKINQTFDKFFNLLNESQGSSFSPYRVHNNQQPQIEKPIITINRQIKQINVEVQTLDLMENKAQQIQQNKQKQMKNQITQTEVNYNDQQQLQNKQIIQQQDKQLQTNDQQMKTYKHQQTNTLQKKLSNFVCQSFGYQCDQKQQIQKNVIKVKVITTEVQTDQITRESLLQSLQQIKHQSKITEKDEEDEQDEQDSENQSQNKNGKKNDDDSDSIFDCNKPDYDSVIEHHEELVDLRRECQERAEQVQQLENSIKQLIKQQREFKFDILITSEQYSLDELQTGKWKIQLKDHEAEQKQTIGVLSSNQNQMIKFVQAMFDTDANVNFNLNQLAIQYYDKEFLENYKLDIMMKIIELPEQFIINSERVYKIQQFQKFWIDFIIQNSSIIIYLINNYNEQDLEIINYIKQQDKKITIITYSDIRIENFNHFNNFKQNIDYQIIKIQDNKTILQSICQEIIQTDWDWIQNDESILIQLQQYIQNIVENDDCIHLQIKEDGIFEISIIQGDLTYDSIIEIPYIKQKEKINNQFKLELNIENNKQINDVKCINNKILIIIDKFILFEEIEEKIEIKFCQINNNNIIILQIIE